MASVEATKIKIENLLMIIIDDPDNIYIRTED